MGLLANKSTLLFFKGDHKKASVNGLSSALTRRQWEFCHAERPWPSPLLPVTGKWDLCQCLLARVSQVAQHPVGECQHFWPHYPVVTSALTHSIPRGEASSFGEERGIGIAAALRLCSKHRRALPFPGHVALPALCFSLLSSVRNRIASYSKQRLLCWGKN